MEAKLSAVAKHYDAVAENYSMQYERERLYETSSPYPANYFRLQLLLNSFVEKKIKRVVEVGVGEGSPLVTLAQAGVDVWGFDISTKMVKRAKENMRQKGLDPAHIFYGDIQDATTYAHVLASGQFDGLMAMGVMPHVENDEKVIKNMAMLVRPGGSVFIEFRNKLFSLFTFNRHTVDFILNDLLKDVDRRLKKLIEQDLNSRLRVDLPVLRTTVNGADAPGYDAILCKFHNPFEVIDVFKKNGFVDVKLLWYHYHPAMPYLDGNDQQLFREEAIKLEHESSNWRGLFLCSAFVIEAKKKE